MKLRLSAMLSAMCVLASAAFAGDGARLSHQGVVAVKGERFTGNGEFRFALVDAETESFVWTNDGSPVVAPNAPIEPVVLAVVNGVFSITLGDPAIENMTPIPESVFHVHDDLVLRVWFDDGLGNGLHQLTPDVDVTDAARAVHAIAAERLIVPGSDASAVHVDAMGRVGVGTTMPEAELHVDGDANVSGKITADGPVTSLNGGFRFPDGTVLTTGLPERGVRGFSATGMFVVPPGVHFLFVELWSAGGGGGGGGG
ncbi:MAG: hypothetical protein HOP29_02935, partial [Phycisphaerales bacterium]|nr:hypothetical protein [Phycisphaerales bacterium]